MEFLVGFLTTSAQSENCFLTLMFPFLNSSSDKSVKVWDVGTRTCVHTFFDHQDQVWHNLHFNSFVFGLLVLSDHFSYPAA